VAGDRRELASDRWAREDQEEGREDQDLVHQDLSSVAFLT
jgi:hypothetical protein